MFSRSRPSELAVRTHLERQGAKAFSYSDVGATRPGAATALPPRAAIDHNRIQLGSGAESFERAKAAIRHWEMFNLGWVELLWPSAPITAGTTVGVLVGALGLWSLNCCRIVYLLDDGGELERYGFAYGTLPDHAESGEERFTVEWNHRDDSVWYDLFAFSRPNQLLAWLGHPYARRLQKQFAAASLVAMGRAASVSI